MCKNQENPSDRISHAWAPLIRDVELALSFYFHSNTLHTGGSSFPFSVYIDLVMV